MDNIIVITQNVKLQSLASLRKFLKDGSETLVVSTQFIFENEAEQIQDALGTKCLYKNFSDLLSDADWDRCDTDAYSDKTKNLADYYATIKEIKNQAIVNKVLLDYPCDNKYLVCDDLGLDEDVWLYAGFKKVECEYYHDRENYQIKIKKRTILRNVASKIKGLLSYIYHALRNDIYVANIDGQKHLFFGSMNRIAYRLNTEFTKASNFENIKFVCIYISNLLLGYVPKNNVIRMSTLHECAMWSFPDHPNFNLKLMQDGYLPPNYSSKYLLFFGKYVEYYTWDKLGQMTFDYHHLKSRVIPFRNKLYIPKPNYPTSIKKVLCVASGAGDWTAVKNRSDEDKMIHAFGKIAAMFPDIEFIYRCHPVWIHPLHQGVNSINRAAEYIDYLNLPNFNISCNIPNAYADGKFILSYKRSSFEDDLKDVDVVFGEHSISMIDAAFKNILFASCNVTGRRDFFAGITAMGFPHCENIFEIKSLLEIITTPEFKLSYEQAIKNYNEMTDKE